MPCHNIPCAHRSMVGPLINYGKMVPKGWKEQKIFYKKYMMKKATLIFFFFGKLGLGVEIVLLYIYIYKTMQAKEKDKKN